MKLSACRVLVAWVGWCVNVEGVGHVNCRFLQRQVVDRRPKVQDVALGVTVCMQAAKDLLVDVD